MSEIINLLSQGGGIFAAFGMQMLNIHLKEKRQRLTL